LKKLVILTAVFLLGCSSWDSVTKTAVGHHIDYVVSQWGPPRNQYEGNGIKVYSWSQYTRPNDINPCTRSLTTNSSGIVISYSLNNCY
jgi:hypothetical protein